MLDRMLKTITSRMDTYTAAAREQRATIERERAGDEARQHAGREFENAEGFTTPLPKAAQRAQNAYARARRDFERNGGASALTLAITMMIARERRDEAAAALKAHLEAEAHRRATGVHKDIAAFFDLMFSHGVEPRHLAEVRPETLAIICDLVRWDGHDPQMEDADSPMPQVFGLYASRLILEPGQFGDRSRSVPGVIVAPARYTDQRHYRFDLPSRPIFSFAGLWRPAENGAVFGFLTTEPNSVVAPIHPKAMPVILDDEGEERWLAGDLDGLVEPFPSQLMTVTQA